MWELSGQKENRQKPTAATLEGVSQQNRQVPGEHQQEEKGKLLLAHHHYEAV